MKTKDMSCPARLVFGLFLLIGIGMLAGAVFALLHGQSVKNTYGKTQATIVGFVPHGYDSNHNQRYRTLITYQVDGESYSASLGDYSSTWYSGKEISVYYDKEQPERVTSGMANMLLPLILGFMGVVFTFLGVVGTRAMKAGEKNEKKLVESGQRIYGKVENVEQNASVSFNGRHPWVAECTYQAPDGKTHVYRSGYLWNQPGEEVIGRTVSIYIDPKHENRYYVDMEPLMQETEIIYH